MFHKQLYKSSINWTMFQYTLLFTSTLITKNVQVKYSNITSAERTELDLRHKYHLTR